MWIAVVMIFIINTGEIRIISQEGIPTKELCEIIIAAPAVDAEYVTEKSGCFFIPVGTSV